MNDEDLKRVGKLIDESNIASEQRVIKVVKELVKGEISASEKRILVEIGTFVTDEILPAIDEKADKSDIDRLERKIDQLADKNYEHDVRLKNIESIPAVAHQLRIKKSK